MHVNINVHHQKPPFSTKFSIVLIWNISENDMNITYTLYKKRFTYFNVRRLKDHFKGMY